MLELTAVIGFFNISHDFLPIYWEIILGVRLKNINAGVMELADVVDSKSTASDGVPVRVRPPAPWRVFL